MENDPYYVLGLPHSANAIQIKRSYRMLAMRLHPDRLTSRGASEEEIKATSLKFASIAAAYALLSDPVQKREYDHVYNLGGYSSSSPPEQTKTTPPPRPPPPPPHSCLPPKPTAQKGIGYKFINPVDYVLSQGKVKSTTVAGVAIPTRFALGNAKAFQVSISTGKAEESSSGSIHCRSTTTTFAEGKKVSKVETTHIDRQGRKETVIRGDDYVERRFETTKPRKRRTLSESVKENDITRAHMTSPNQNPTSWQEKVAHVYNDPLPWHQKVANFYKDFSSNVQRCTNPALINPSEYITDICGVHGAV